MKKINLTSIVLALLLVGAVGSPVAIAKGPTKHANKQEKKQEQEKKKEEKSTDQLNDRKDSLLKVIDNHVEQWLRTKDRVSGMPNIDQAAKNKLATIIDEAVKKLTDFKTKVSAAKTLSEVKSLRKELDKLLKNHKGIIQEIVDAIHDSRVAANYNTVAGRIQDFDSKLQTLKSQGKTVDDLVALLNSAKDHLNQAKAALDKKDKATAVDHLEEANKILKDLNSKIRALK